jgi:hypothetical protein
VIGTGAIPNAIRAGFVYFVLVFAAGFIIGVIRISLVVPAIGEFRAVALELPFILSWSWIVCRWLLRCLLIDRMPSRLIMGTSAFACLMAAEFATFTLLTGQAPADWVARFEQPAQILGLVGQIAFALFPLFL